MTTATHDAAVTFRAATAADQGEIEALLTRTGLPTAGVPEILAKDPSQFVVAFEGTQLVASAAVEECCEHALLRSVAVAESWRARGLGRSLIEHAVAQATARNINGLYLLTMTAEHYFPRFGFRRVERDAVPAEIASTVEFTGACPASAVPMHLPLRDNA